MEVASTMRTLELDKICRVCLTVKKDMRPIFGEMVADMLMECARVQVMSEIFNFNLLQFDFKRDVNYFE